MSQCSRLWALHLNPFTLGLLVRYAFLYHSSTVIAPAYQMPLVPSIVRYNSTFATLYLTFWSTHCHFQSLLSHHMDEHQNLWIKDEVSLYVSRCPLCGNMIIKQCFQKILDSNQLNMYGWYFEFIEKIWVLLGFSRLLYFSLTLESASGITVGWNNISLKSRDSHICMRWTNTLEIIFLWTVLPKNCKVNIELWYVL